MLIAHDEVLKRAPGATVLSQVGIKTEGIQGRGLASGLWTGQPDIKLDLLVESGNGVFCAIEVSGREHRYGTKPAFDEKKKEALDKFHVPLIVLELTSNREVPLAKWQQQLKDAEIKGWLVTS